MFLLKIILVLTVTSLEDYRGFCALPNQVRFNHDILLDLLKNVLMTVFPSQSVLVIARAVMMLNYVRHLAGDIAFFHSRIDCIVFATSLLQIRYSVRVPVIPDMKEQLMKTINSFPVIWISTNQVIWWRSL